MVCTVYAYALCARSRPSDLVLTLTATHLSRFLSRSLVGKRCAIEGCKKPASERTNNYCTDHFGWFRQEAEAVGTSAAARESK